MTRLGVLGAARIAVTGLIPAARKSSQARGFFVRADPADCSDPELVRCWYSEENLARLARSKELAKAKGVDVIQIALAYVRHQPLPTFALIGPRTVAETASSLKALEFTLTPEEVGWLEGTPQAVH